MKTTIKETKERKTMKRFFNVLLIVLAGLFAFVACSPQAGFSDELVNVSIEGSSQMTGRALIVETDFDISKVKVWKYTAAKADSGLDTGATTEQVALVKDESGNWMTKSLSQGSWNFVLYGYSDEAGSTLVCSGSVDNQTITVANHNVKITVRPSQTTTGNIVIKDDIKIVKQDGTEYSGSEYEKTVKVTNASGDDVTSQIDSAVASGRYKVEVVFTGTSNGEEYTAAKAFKYINVYDNLTTTVSGTINEIEQAGNVDPEGGMIKAEAEATVAVEDQKNKETVEIAVASTPAGTTDEKKTTVKFPAKSVSMGEDSTKLTLKVESSSIQAASTSYTVETEEGAPVAGFKFTLEGAASTTFDTDDGVEVETFIETGLGEVNNIKIKYIGSSEGKAPEIVSYDSSTGKLVFKVYHFSTYVIIAGNTVAVDNNGKFYATLQAAIDAATGSGVTKITLLCDASGSGLESKDASGNAVGARGDITIDFGGHTYTVTNTSVGSTGTETQAMHWGRSIKSITMKNGKFATTQFDTLKMGMQNYVDFTAEDMTFDMSNVDVVKFGANEFSGNNAIYNGKEVAIFNNNKGDMKLTKCTVILPVSSEMGMSADGGSVTLTETTVNGAVNMQDSTSKLIKDAQSKITKGVIAYFSDTYDVEETTADNLTTYTLKAKSTT